MAPVPTKSMPASAPLSVADLKVRLVSSIAEIEAAAWDACANPAGDGAAYNPFIAYDFLRALEDSRSTGGRSGWQPAHLVVEDGTGAVLGVAPSYLKSHSQGEYVFDHAFADAYARAGGAYYPKIQVSVPFTPATGRRLLVRPGTGSAAAREALARGLIGMMRQLEASSVHLTFEPEEEHAYLTAGELPYLSRFDIQYHWTDEGYGDFAGFLGALSSRKRKVLKRERRDALANGLSIRWITGGDLTERDWDAFWKFYQDTGSRKWGRPYLTRDFFSRVNAAMADRILLVVAERDGRPVAGALNFIGGDTLFGRYWGCVEDHPFLHFEVCYYQAIDFALARGLKRVEAGAQGQHKLARGYRPTITRSAHAFADPGLGRAVADYLRRERAEMMRIQTAMDDDTPFKAEPEEP
ncbi:MAG TPA: GNAT family N-acetyltransferase [Hyphomicrobiales bacterium]|nr:GNAT family N-acetyltransferase [Hyphomicrobiales bacterium]